jgi:SagB-type dehydrogenase family enzyme
MATNQTGGRLGFLCAPVDDPRRIQLREERFLKAYRDRDILDDVVEIGHETTKLRRVNDGDVADALSIFAAPWMYSVEYSQDREYPLQARIPLPEPCGLDRSFGDVVRGRRSTRHFAGKPLAIGEVSTLLFCAVGETGRLAAGVVDDQLIDVSLRSIPSGGGLHPTRVFVALLRPGDLERGIYHYDALDHQVEFVKPLPDSEIEALFAAFPIHPFSIDLGPAAAIFFISTKFWRVRAKYGSRGYRYCLQEAGSACQNLSLAATALGLAHVVLGGFYDDEVHDCLEIDGVDHAVITAVAVGTPQEQSETESRRVDY